MADATSRHGESPARGQPASSRSPLGHRAGVLAVVGFSIVFWLALGVAGAAEPGYDPIVDRISPLAAPDAAARPFGVLAVVAAGCALICCALGLRGLVRDAPTPGRLLLAAGALVVIAAVVPLTSAWHDPLVLVAQLLVTSSMLVLGRQAHAAGRSLLAAFAVGGGLVTLVLSLDPGPWPPGVDQRVWVASLQVLVIVLAAWPPSSQRPSD